jgi:hypothetical protein
LKSQNFTHTNPEEPVFEDELLRVTWLTTDRQLHIVAFMTKRWQESHFN